MSTLLPTLQAADLRRALTDYLATTFALTDVDARTALTDFLEDQQTGIFKGPWTRLRVPFEPAEDGWQDSLDWLPDGFSAYAHQAAAFARLTSKPNSGDSLTTEGLRRPQPALVTTGTGSGKTEAFVYPIIDHALRTRSLGIRGMKALILYPMNALANDQAGRLTSLITKDPRLSRVTAAIYTGEQQSERTIVSERGLITDRAIIRDDPPDILLTNYKMLDQLLLRHDDRRLWTASAHSLRYLVLDEFHTYDGAQGTDVAMLIRRLGMILSRHRTTDHEGGDKSQSVLGPITPVATSATLGDGGDPSAMIDFARTVFGVPIEDNAVITERRLDVDAWADSWSGSVAPSATVQLKDILNAADDLDGVEDPESITERIVRMFAGVGTAVLGGAPVPRSKSHEPHDQAAVLLAAPQIRSLLRDGHLARSALDLLMIMTDDPIVPADRSQAERWVEYLLAAFSHLRSRLGRDFVNVETHLWIRELTRLDRLASSAAGFRWADEGERVHELDSYADGARPALYCRHCGRSGWGIYLEPTGTAISDARDIRGRHRNHERYFRALIHARSEYDAGQLDDLSWWDTRHSTLNRALPDTDTEEYATGRILPVLTHRRDDEDLAANDDCPSCLGKDGIRFLGSAIATQLSVSLSALFGSARIENAEKKALVFTDSVQDAAHRAGFIQARSYTLTLRSAIADAADVEPMTLDDLAEAMLREAGNDPFRRYRLLHPELVDRARFVEYWQEPNRTSATVRRHVRRRILFDLSLEFGLQSRFGRTLETTGAASVAVDAGTVYQLGATARRVLGATSLPLGPDDPLSEREQIQWVRGVLEHMRGIGAIGHDWLRPFMASDGNRWRVWGGRPRDEGMPAFPPGRSTPSFPRIGSPSGRRDPLLEQATSPQGWYARWAQRTLGIPAAAGATLTRLLLDDLADQGILTPVATDNSIAVSATSYAIPSDRVLVGLTTDIDLRERRQLLRCDVCHAEQHGTAEIIEQLADAPCLLVRCSGRLRPQAMDVDNYYRRLYRTPDMRRIVAREHTGLLPAEVRLDYEEGFKQAAAYPDAPNVLVATPTLEMGIDIGSLSTVFLSSLPRTVASYLQRIGRAGRLTGNALDLAYVTGHRRNLGRLDDPLSVVNGAVRPPATWLSAEEILHRQYFAHVVDRIAGRDDLDHPRVAPAVLGSFEPGSYLAQVGTYADDHADQLLAEFLATFDGLRPEVIGRLRDWAHPSEAGTSPMTELAHRAVDRWNAEGEGLNRRRTTIQQALPALQQRANLPQPDDEDVRAFRSAKAALAHLGHQIGDRNSQHWVAALEEAGLLPNYTLLDDSVTLDVVVTWLDPDTQDWQEEDASISRPSSQALREFAPGSRFYARGMEIKIDAVDLGSDGDAIRSWAFCAECGWVAEADVAGACPRCGSTSPQDTGQRLPVVELTSVSAQMRRDEAMINDNTDQRETAAHTIVTLPDLAAGDVSQQWSVDGYDFGIQYFDRLTIRWLNLGRRGTGASWQVAGEQTTAPLFRVCRGCGVQDRQAQNNRPDEHRPWCSYRSATGEDHVETIALSRTLQTQGVLITLPMQVTLGDSFALPSLTAALLLGLREQFGGDPDHLGVTACTAPNLHGTNREALLLHDLVPGGTGYLADLATSDQAWRLIHRAWKIVRDCSCADQDQLCCHRCLLPFAGSDVGQVSRAAAERHLHDILTAGNALPEPGPGPQWAVTEQNTSGNDVPASWLELQFYEAFRNLAEELSARVIETPGAYGNRMQLRLPGQLRSWTLEPQVLMHGSKPDFVLRSDDAKVPTMAIFTDGRAFHASVTNNNLADDAAKRTALRDAGVYVLSVTARDVTAEQAGSPISPPRWWSEALRPRLIQQFPTTAAVLDNINSGPFGVLRKWLTNPEMQAQTDLATWLPLGLLAANRDGQPEGELGQRAENLLVDFGGGPGAAGWWSAPGVVIAVRPVGKLVACCALIDDTDDALSSDAARDAWQDWLAIANALQLSQAPTVISTLSAAATAPIVSVGAVPTPVQEEPELSEEWAAAYGDCITEDERRLVVDLAQSGVPLVTVGQEVGPENVPVELAWPDLKIAVLVGDTSGSNRAETLVAEGWSVVPATVEAIKSAMEGTAR